MEQTKTKKFNTYGVTIEGETKYFKTDVEIDVIESAIQFVKNGEVTVDKVLVAIRMLGGKATPISIDPEYVFEV